MPYLEPQTAAGAEAEGAGLLHETDAVPVGLAPPLPLADPVTVPMVVPGVMTMTEVPEVGTTVDMVGAGTTMVEQEPFGRVDV